MSGVKTILLVDDDSTVRTLIKTTLATPSYGFVEAGDGLTAIKVCRKNTPDLVILDWMMPGLNGLQVLKRLRGSKQTRDLPVIMLTSRDDEADRAKAMSFGGCWYVVKPFSPLELIETTEEILLRP